MPKVNGGGGCGEKNEGDWVWTD